MPGIETLSNDILSIAMSKHWRPIETLPPDAGAVLIYAPPIIMVWSGTFEAATHWMPLPEPPSQFVPERPTS